MGVVNNNHRPLQFSLRTLFAELTLWCILVGAVAAILNSELPQRAAWSVYAVCLGLFGSLLPITRRLDVLSVWGGLISIWVVEIGSGKIHGPLFLIWFYSLKYGQWPNVFMTAPFLLHLFFFAAATSFFIASLLDRRRMVRDVLAVAGISLLLISWLSIVPFWNSWLKVLTSLPLLMFCALRLVAAFITPPKTSSPHSP